MVSPFSDPLNIVLVLGICPQKRRLDGNKTSIGHRLNAIAAPYDFSGAR